MTHIPDSTRRADEPAVLCRRYPPNVVHAYGGRRDKPAFPPYLATESRKQGTDHVYLSNADMVRQAIDFVNKYAPAVQ
jgi:hypothetical protein